MDLRRILKRHPFLSFLFGLCFLFTPMQVLASEQPAPALPSSELPVLSDYRPDTADYPLSRGLLPARYDAREMGYVTPVKDQDPWGSCWAFGTLSAGESNMIKKGLATTAVDLSEMHLAYFFYQCPKDPMGLTLGDSIRNNTGNHFLDTGGNNLFTMFALSKWLGPVPETLVPYSSQMVNPAYAYQDTAHMQNARFVNSSDSINVKHLIMEYGAVSTSIFYHPTFQNDNGAYLFPYSGYPTNHIVSIVGWDDNYSRDHFQVVFRGEKISPSADGAWIVKNSYGTSKGDQGYIYVSYEDISVNKSDGDYLSYAFDLEQADNYDHNYQYDGSFGSGISTSMNGTSLANVYTVQGNPGGNEQLDAVSFSLFSQNVRYSIQIYKNPSPGNPSSGNPVFKNPQTGYTTYSGYYTIPLKSKPVFAQGDTFSVVITLSSASSSSVSYFIDQTMTVSDLQFISASAKNQSFYKSEASDGWIDLHNLGSGKTARIKAFTTNTTLPVTNVEQITGTLKRPSITSIKRTGTRRVKLTWKSVKQAEKYEIYRSLKKNGTYQRIGTTAKAFFTDKKAVPGATCYYKIRARRTLNGSPAYGRFCAVKSVKLKLDSPGLTSAKSVPVRKVRLKWKKMSGVRGYEVFRSSSRKKGYKKIATVKKPSFTDRVAKKKTWYYKVRAYSIVNGKKVYSGFSAVKEVAVKK